jgi:hypothetical protein
MALRLSSHPNLKVQVGRFFLIFTNTRHFIFSGAKASYRLKLRETTKPQQSTKYDMNDCLLESENFQITKSDNNKYLLLPVTKTQQAEKFVLKECGKDIDSLTQNLLSYFTHSHTHAKLISFLPFLIFNEHKNKIRKPKNPKNYLSPNHSFTKFTVYPLVSLCLIVLECLSLRLMSDIGCSRKQQSGRGMGEMSCPQCRLMNMNIVEKPLPRNSTIQKFVASVTQLAAYDFE